MWIVEIYWFGFKKKIQMRYVDYQHIGQSTNTEIDSELLTGMRIDKVF